MHNFFINDVTGTQAEFYFNFSAIGVEIGLKALEIYESNPLQKMDIFRFILKRFRFSAMSQFSSVMKKYK